MQDQPNQQPKNLSEISHLFLSSVRERQTQGANRPMRIPPGGASQTSQAARPLVSIDLTPEEFAHVLDDGLALRAEDELRVAPVTAIIAPHLGSNQSQRAREYAAHLCAAIEKRVGLIELDAGEFRLSCFERNSDGAAAGSERPAEESLEARVINEALEELSWDVSRWLVLMPNTRLHETRTMLRQINHWVLLATCDHEGVVACYRTLKGLTEQYAAEGSASRPRLSVALIGASDEAQAARTYRKLAGVCQQFLSWPLEQERAVRSASQVAEHRVLNCEAHRDKSAVASAVQWQVVTDFVARSDTKGTVVLPKPMEPAAETILRTEPLEASEVRPTIVYPSEPISRPTQQPATPQMTYTPDDAPEVIDLPNGATSPGSIVTAVVSGDPDLIECPIKPPMCPEASLAVTRDRRLLLVAVAKQGLSDLRQIGKAYQWLLENRPLIGMAVPQLSIDAHQLPQLHVLVDHADMTAEILQPMLQAGNVKVHAFRKLRWGAKTGLLLEAA